MNEALRDWVANVDDTYYFIGTAAGRIPIPRWCAISNPSSAKRRAPDLEAEGRLPDTLVACVGGGSNAIGLFHPFLDDRQVEIYGVEAAGKGLYTAHAASLTGGAPGVLHGNRTYLLQDETADQEPIRFPPASIIPASVRNMRGCRDRAASICSATDDEALDAFQLCRSGGHHSGARTGACARQSDEHRAAKAERSSYGGEHLRPRRQGHLHRRQTSRRDVITYFFGVRACRNRSCPTSKV